MNHRRTIRREHTGQHKEHHPVNDQDGPEDRDVENREPTADEADEDGAGGGVPELELGQTADEGAELVVLLGRQAGGGVPVLKALILREGGVELGLQEEEEEVQEVDAERVGNCSDDWLVIWVLSRCAVCHFVWAPTVPL